MDHPLQSVGHSDLVQHTDGTWWMIFHGVRHQGYPPMHHMGRETCLTPIEWPEGEWPSVPQGNFLPLELTAPSDAAAQSKHTEIERADFSSGQLDLSWNFRRNPLDDAWSLSRVPGALSLRCAATTLDDKSPLAWVGRRQTLLSAQVETELHFDPQENGEEAGLSVMMNERYYATLGLLCENGERVVRLTQKFGDVTVERASVIMPEAQSLRLRIVGDPSLYHFQIWKGETWHELQTVETRHLSTELAGGFTGVYWGMFATGHGVDRQRWAEFRSFNVEALNSQ
jgi:alpha-N-arabinofuranosidase